jgi:DNA-binding XRE family transcriptional regulator
MEVAKIRNLHVWGIHQVNLAKMFKVSKQTICSIIYNETYTK